MSNVEKTVFEEIISQSNWHDWSADCFAGAYAGYVVAGWLRQAVVEKGGLNKPNSRVGDRIFLVTEYSSSVRNEGTLKMIGCWCEKKVKEVV